MKTALVTGGNKGIGLAAAKGLAEKGFRVFIGSRDEKRGREAAETLTKSGLNVEQLTIDVSDAKSIEGAAKKLASLTDSLDVLVNNAGVYLDRNANALNVDPKVIFETLGTNTVGPLLTSRAFAPLLAKAKGQVINVSSGMGQLADMSGGSAAYRISKAALNAVTRILASELAGQHIRVNSICPGWVKTDMGGQEAPRSVEQGADTIVWLATDSKENGSFFRDRKAIAW